MPIFRYPFFYNPNYYNRFTNYKMYNCTENTNMQNSQHNYNNSNHINKSQNSTNKYNYDTPSNYTSATSSEQSTGENFCDNKKNNSKSKHPNDNYFFELFGLKLYFDDILLICLIFFLYEEGVKDDELFLSLVLLLLT